MDALKRCSACGRELPLDGFHRNRRNRDGLQGRCKPCHTDTNPPKTWVGLYELTLEDCWMKHHADRTPTKTVIPDSSSASPRTAVYDAGTNRITWPGITRPIAPGVRQPGSPYVLAEYGAQAFFTAGSYITAGIPAGGHYGLVGSPGLGYVSPGYAVVSP